MTEKRKILFLCNGNSCRSQMAEGFARHLAAERFDAYSAGSVAKGVDPRAVSVMAEAGVDIGSQRSKTTADLGDMSFDIVVTLCSGAQESCPFYPGGTEIIHRGFDDPPELARGVAEADGALAIYRRVRDEIKAFIEEILC